MIRSLELKSRNALSILAARWHPRGVRSFDEPKNGEGEPQLQGKDSKQHIKRHVKKGEKETGNVSVEDVREALNEGMQTVRNLEAEFPSDKRQKAKLLKWFPGDSTDVKSGLPERPSAILFPGHGSQFVGMGKNLLQYPEAKRVYEQANAILGFNLLNTCLHGSATDLQGARISQLAIFVTSVAALEKLKAEHPQAIEDCISTAGYSVGEYAALVFAGAMSFEDALRIVDIRASAMQSLCEAVPSAACSVFVTAASSLNELLVAARQAAKRDGVASPICNVAEYVATNVKVVGGHVQCIRFVEANHSRFNVTRCQLLNVSGAYHTLLMRDAAKKLNAALEKVTINMPQITVYSNYNAEPFRSRYSVVRKLSEAVYHTVKWEQTMHTLYRYGMKYDAFKQRREELEPPRTYEVGPGRQLGVLLRNTNGRAFRQGYTSVDV